MKKQNLVPNPKLRQTVREQLLPQPKEIADVTVTTPSPDHMIDF